MVYIGKQELVRVGKVYIPERGNVSGLAFYWESECMTSVPSDNLEKLAHSLKRFFILPPRLDTAGTNKAQITEPLSEQQDSTLRRNLERPAVHVFSPELYGPNLKYDLIFSNGSKIQTDLETLTGLLKGAGFTRNDIFIYQYTNHFRDSITAVSPKIKQSILKSIEK